MERLTLLDIVKKLISSDEYGPDVQWCLSELRDILEIVGDMSGDRLRELIEADRDGRCMVLQSQYAETTGGEALRRLFCFPREKSTRRKCGWSSHWRIWICPVSRRARLMSRSRRMCWSILA